MRPFCAKRGRCLLAGLLLMLAVPVFAAEETDYDALFAGGGSTADWKIFGV